RCAEGFGGCVQQACEVALMAGHGRPRADCFLYWVLRRRRGSVKRTIASAPLDADLVVHEVCSGWGPNPAAAIFRQREPAARVRYATPKTSRILRGVETCCLPTFLTAARRFPLSI